MYISISVYHISYTCALFSIHEYCLVRPNKMLPLPINYKQFFTLYTRRPEEPLQIYKKVMQKSAVEKLSAILRVN